VFEVKKENRLNCEILTVGFPQNDCVAISQPKRLDLLDEPAFVVEQNEILTVARRVLKARLEPHATHIFVHTFIDGAILCVYINTREA
jgi:hypothetical protein